ncbi:MAG: amidohydrolase family protein [Acidobacteria bacterium]|nr:amidohydrolase family protein [Acidobacteriota bacterium]
MTSILTARWLLPITSPPIDGGAVAIENELILETGNLQELHKRYPHASVRDFGNCAILPGLVNVHTHLELTVFRGRLEESHFQSWIRRLITLKAERLSSEDLMLSARLGCIELIRAGVTTLCRHFGFERTDNCPD